MRGRSVLTVTDIEGAERHGAIIVLFNENNRIRMRINLAAAKASQLVISSKLLRPAEVVGNGGRREMATRVAHPPQAQHDHADRPAAIALLMTTLLFLLGAVVVTRQSNLQQLQILSEAIASNSTAALAFENPDDARSVLSPPSLGSAHRRGRALQAPTAVCSPRIRSRRRPARCPRRRARRVTASRVRVADRHHHGARRPADCSEPCSSAPTCSRSTSASGVRADRGGGHRAHAARGLGDLAPAADSSSRSPFCARRHRGSGLRAGTTTACARAAGINELDTLTDAFNHMLTQTEQYERRLSTQVSRLALLQEITHSIGSRHDLLSIFQVVLGSLEEHLPIHFGCVCLHDAATGTIDGRVRRAASGAHAATLGLTPRSFDSRRDRTACIARCMAR